MNTCRTEQEAEDENIMLTGDVDRMTDDTFIALVQVTLRDTPSDRKKELYRALWDALCPIAGKFVPE